MRCPTKTEIPPPPSGKSGWPWTIETPRSEDTQPDGSAWPRISIVTPSFNQAQYLEETIRSVLLQGYANLEYIIVDGGSKDGSEEIIKKYESWLSYWVSEPDKGQANAINKGFAHSTGSIMAWINSDDYYASNALQCVARTFSGHPTEWVAGYCFKIKLAGDVYSGRGRPEEDIKQWFSKDLYSQPSVFWKRSLWEKTRTLDESMDFSFDYDLWHQFSLYQPFATWLDQHLAYFRFHTNSKSVLEGQKFYNEDKIIYKRYLYRIKLIPDRLKTWFQRGEFYARYQLSAETLTIPILKTIWYVLRDAPWYIFKPRFYKKMMVLLMHSYRKSLD